MANQYTHKIYPELAFIMKTEQVLKDRSESKCELCNSTENLQTYEVPPSSNATPDECILICDTCREQIEHPDKVDVNHWRCLNESMWSQLPAVQVMGEAADPSGPANCRVVPVACIVTQPLPKECLPASITRQRAPGGVGHGRNAVIDCAPSAHFVQIGGFQL